MAGTRQEDLEAARADHERARVRAAFWVAELKRNEELVERGVVTPSTFQQIQREHDAMKQEELATKARLARAEAGARAEEIDAARAKLEADQQAVAIAERELKKTTLTAPFAGRVERRLLDAGAYVNVFPTGGVPVVHLVDLREVDARISVPEALLSRLNQVEAIEVAAEQVPGLRAAGKTIALGRTADPATGTYLLRVRIPNKQRRWTGGMAVTATITTASARDVMRVPVTAVQRAYGQPPHVLSIDATDRVISRPVELGPVAATHIEIVSGLSDGEVVIVRGQHQVIAGDRVQVQPAAAAVSADVPAGGSVPHGPPAVETGAAESVPHGDAP